MSNTNLKKYNQVFMESFDISEELLGDSLEYNGIEAWDSLGHMGMIEELENVFKITFDADDIVDFSSYKKGKEILEKYEVEIA